jgi:uncharacterized cupin superfamily protein
MGDFTIRNLKEIRDQAPSFGHSPSLEARFAREELECRQSGLSYQRLAPGFRMPFGHRHKQQEELYVLVSGNARMKLDDEVKELRQWDVVRVGNGTTRCLEGGPDGAEFLVFGAPNTGHADVEMTPGWWSD